MGKTYKPNQDLVRGIKDWIRKYAPGGLAFQPVISCVGDYSPYQILVEIIRGTDFGRSIAESAERIFLRKSKGIDGIIESS